MRLEPVKISDRGFVAMVGVDIHKIDFACAVEEFRQGALNITGNDVDVMAIQYSEIFARDLCNGGCSLKGGYMGGAIGEIKCIHAEGSAKFKRRFTRVVSDKALVDS